MQTVTTSDARLYDSQVRDFIDGKHQRLAEILHDYDDTLSLEYIPSLDRDAGDIKPFRIRQTPRDGRESYIVRYLSASEMDDPAHVLEWIWEGDFRKHNPDDIFNRLEARRIAQELLKTKQELDEREAHVDLMANLALGGRDRKHYYRHNGRVFHRG